MGLTWLIFTGMRRYSWVTCLSCLHKGWFGNANSTTDITQHARVIWLSESLLFYFSAVAFKMSATSLDTENFLCPLDYFLSICGNHLWIRGHLYRNERREWWVYMPNLIMEGDSSWRGVIKQKLFEVNYKKEEKYMYVWKSMIIMFHLVLL